MACSGGPPTDGPCSSPTTTWAIDQAINPNALAPDNEVLLPSPSDAAEGVYANYLDQDEQRVWEAYGDWYERLFDAKNGWGPDDLFRVNQNIEPTV